MDTARFRVMTMEQLEKSAKKYQTKMDKIVKHDKNYDAIVIYDMKHPYVIELSRIPDKEALLEWVQHLSEKLWITKEILNEFIEKVMRIKKLERISI